MLEQQHLLLTQRTGQPDHHPDHWRLVFMAAVDVLRRPHITRLPGFLEAYHT